MALRSLALCGWGAKSGSLREVNTLPWPTLLCLALLLRLHTCLLRLPAYVIGINLLNALTRRRLLLSRLCLLFGDSLDTLAWLDLDRRSAASVAYLDPLPLVASCIVYPLASVYPDIGVYVYVARHQDNSSRIVLSNIEAYSSLTGVNLSGYFGSTHWSTPVAFLARSLLTAWPI